MQIEILRRLAINSSEVKKGIEELGFTELFPIQAQAIMSPYWKEKTLLGKHKQEPEKPQPLEYQ